MVIFHSYVSLPEGTALNQEEKENFYQVQRCYCGGLFGMKLVLCSTRAIRTDVKSSKVGVASKLVKSRSI